MRHDRGGAAGGLWLALFHLACCGGPLLVLLLISAGASVSLAGVLAALPYLAAAGAALALGALVFYFARRCPSCGRRGAWVHDLNHPRETDAPPGADR